MSCVLSRDSDIIISSNCRVVLCAVNSGHDEPRDVSHGVGSEDLGDRGLQLFGWYSANTYLGRQPTQDCEMQISATV
jgi:hypothetical protein